MGKNRIWIIVLLLTLGMLFLYGCSNQANKGNSNKDISLSGDPLKVLSDAIKNLQQLTNFQAKKTLTVKINGKETSVNITDFDTNTSNLFSISSVYIKDSEQKISFKRVHLKNVQYEFDPDSGKWETIDKDNNGFNFTYSYYILNRNLVLGLVNDIYSVKNNKFGEFVMNLQKVGTEMLNNHKVVVYEYKYNSSDDSRIIDRKGKIYIGIINGKTYPLEIYDDRIVKFRKSGTTVENITQIVITNIGNATPIAFKQ